MSPFLASTIFVLCVLVFVALDLGVLHRRAQRISFGDAFFWSIFWIVLSLVFAYGVYLFRGSEAGLEFLTAYLLEKSLSLDNLFVFTLIFSYMAVPAETQHKVLTLGIIGALIMRGAMIAAGLALVSHFHWILYVFGAFLVFSGAKFLFRGQESVDPGQNIVLRLARRMFSVTEGYSGGSFVVKREGRRWVTPLLLVLLLIETTDIVFALDSIPAVFAVTQDAFIVFTSNILAILGLRALYFVLAGALQRFRFMRVGLSLLLIFVGIKMLVAKFFTLPTHVSFAVILGVLALTIILSLLFKPRREADEATPGK